MREVIKYIIENGIHDSVYCNCFFTYRGLLGLLNILENHNIEISTLGIGFYDGKIFDDYWESCEPSDPFNFHQTTKELYDFANLFKKQENVHFELYFKDKRIHTIIDYLYEIN